MTRRPDTSLAALLLTQRLVDTGVTPLKASEYWQLLDVVADPARLLGSDGADIAHETGLDPELAERAARLLDAATSVAFQLDEVEQQGMRVVASVDDGYPAVLRDRLGRAAPPLLYVVGDPSLLAGELLGVVGSRDVDEAAADVARAAGARAVVDGWGVVSGAAKGVDRLAMEAALDAGGVAVGVLADSLARMTRDPAVRRAVVDGRLCLCTPYKPTAPFSVAQAMGRNKLIYALSQATLVVTSAEGSGGTWAGAEEALKKRYAPVLVWRGEGEGPGNAGLVSKGAAELSQLDDVLSLAQRSLDDGDPPSAPTDQLRLDV